MWKLYVGGTLLVVAILLGLHYLLVNRAYDMGYNMALAEAKEKTTEAINELSSEAEKARMLRIACIGRGGMWDFAQNECNEKHP